MPKAQFKQKITEIKATIKDAIQAQHLVPEKKHNPFHNPIAQLHKDRAIHFTAQERDTLKECQNSAKLVITPENHKILVDYFKQRRKTNDKLGQLYQTLSFSDFILRLLNKRFQEVYFDGRAVVLRDGTSHGGPGGKAFLQRIGTSADRDNDYREYLTLEESVLSTLVLPQATSVVVGTGNRSHETDWDVYKEFTDSIDAAVISYPAAAEFRNGHTAHYDYLFIIKPEYQDAQYRQQVQNIKSNVALMQAAKSIYGEALALNDDEVDDGYESLTVQGNRYYLNVDAYLQRTQNVIKSILQAQDAQMREYGLGKTLQLKGLGLGAFGFSGEQNSKILEGLYLEAVENVLNDETLNLKHINCVNLINLPSDFKNPALTNKKIIKAGNFNKVKLIRSKMEPTENTRRDQIGDIGAVVVCGDSGSKFGNEGNIGLDRSSSDDPAAQYSLLDPLILDPDANPILKNKKCIQVVENGAFKALKEPSLSIRRRTAIAQYDLQFKKNIGTLGAGLISWAVMYFVLGTSLSISFAAAGLMTVGVATFIWLSDYLNVPDQLNAPRQAINRGDKEEALVREKPRHLTPMKNRKHLGERQEKREEKTPKQKRCPR